MNSICLSTDMNDYLYEPAFEDDFRDRKGEVQQFILYVR